MVLEKLGDSLKGTLKKIAGSLFVDEKLINELVKDLQRALLQSDVNVKLVFELTKRIKERAIKEDVARLTKREHLVNIVYEELVVFLGGDKQTLDIEGKKPAKIMLVGLFGSGKTTTTSKLARYYMKRGKKVAVVGLDIHRPAAMEQLKQLAEDLNCKHFINTTSKNAVEIYKEIEPQLSEFDLVIVDTAGRDALSEDLIKEIEDVNTTVNADEKILIISGDIGQAAQTQAQAFHDAVGITGVIVTKMDGTAKGGGALSACAITGTPIKFLGVGEKPRDLEPFNPKGFVGRLLGMGDLEALLDKAQEAMSGLNAPDLEKKLLKGEFNLLDLYNQMEAMNKMGPLGKVMEMIPGMGSLKIPKEALKVQEAKLKKWRYAMNSMTRLELEQPEELDAHRLERISNGSAISIKDLRDLLKQYKQSKKMVKMLKGGNPEKLMKKLKGKKGMPGMKF
jgi:signal recognition particle subunit SRP54